MQRYHPPQTKRIVRNSQGFDLDSLISILKNDKKWIKGEMNSMILLRNSSRSVVLVILHEKTEIKSRLNSKHGKFSDYRRAAQGTFAKKRS